MLTLSLPWLLQSGHVVSVGVCECFLGHVQRSYRRYCDVCLFLKHTRFYIVCESVFLVIKFCCRWNMLLFMLSSIIRDFYYCMLCGKCASIALFFPPSFVSLTYGACFHKHLHETIVLCLFALQGAQCKLSHLIGKKSWFRRCNANQLKPMKLGNKCPLVKHQNR